MLNTRYNSVKQIKFKYYEHVTLVCYCLAVNMIILLVITIATILTRVNILAEKYDLDSLNNTKEFLNFGDKEVNKIIKDNLNNNISKSKVDVLGAVFKKEIDAIKLAHQTDFVFLIDGSSSVGEINFQSELKFVKKILSDVTVDYNHSRVAIITFSSSSNIVSIFLFISYLHYLI